MRTADKRDPALLLDIVLAADDVAEFVRGLDQPGFEASRLHQFAVLRCTAVIGEAANRLSPEMRAATTEIHWSSIIGMRHRLVHDYDQVDLAIVWRVITIELPALVAALRPLLPPERQG